MTTKPWGGSRPMTCASCSSCEMPCRVWWSLACLFISVCSPGWVWWGWMVFYSEPLGLFLFFRFAGGWRIVACYRNLVCLLTALTLNYTSLYSSPKLRRTRVLITRPDVCLADVLIEDATAWLRVESTFLAPARLHQGGCEAGAMRAANRGSNSVEVRAQASISSTSAQLEFSLARGTELLLGPQPWRSAC